MPGSTRLDPREEQFRIASPLDGLQLFLRFLPAAPARADAPKVVLYVHGATFPSALSIAHRFDGRAWRDDLNDAGFDVWSFDFLGFGNSDSYPEMDDPADQHAALGDAQAASRQIEQAVRFICDRQRVARVSIIAHSWGTIATSLFATRCPGLVDRLVFFGPVTWRPRQAAPQRAPAWRLVSVEDQWKRFIADCPSGEPPVLSRRHFDAWAPLYLDTDPRSRDRAPPSVKIPGGPAQDIADAWAGNLAYDPSRIQAPLAIIRGEWDSLVTDADARWLFDALTASPVRRDIKIARATHLMHLEENRVALYREAEVFLRGDDRPRTAA